LRPLVHLGADFFGDAQEAWVFGDRELEVALVVERHGIDLPEGVLAIEHPAVSAREQSVSDVAQAVSVLARGRVAGPVPWIHWRIRSAGISLPSKFPSRAS
jgi:hypothetical protein